MYDQYEKDNNEPGLIAIIMLIVFCVVIAFLDLGDAWYEILIKIFAFLISLSMGFRVYSFITNLITHSNSKLKRFFHFIMLLVMPLMIYGALEVYLI